MTPKGRFRCTMLLVNAVDADADADYADADDADADGVADACDGEDDAVDTA